MGRYFKAQLLRATRRRVPCHAKTKRLFSLTESPRQERDGLVSTPPSSAPTQVLLLWRNRALKTGAGGGRVGYLSSATWVHAIDNLQSAGIQFTACSFRATKYSAAAPVANFTEQPKKRCRVRTGPLTVRSSLCVPQRVARSPGQPYTGCRSQSPLST